MHLSKNRAVEVPLRATTTLNGVSQISGHGKRAAHFISIGLFILASGVAYADTQPPTAPTNFAGSVFSFNQVNFTWTASTDNVGVSGYVVEGCWGGSCTNFVQLRTSTATRISVTGLDESTTYSFRVLAKDAAGNSSGYSNVISVTTPAAPYPPPTVPSSLTATLSSDTQANLSWGASTSNGLTLYRFERCIGSICSDFMEFNQQAASLPTTLVAGSLNPATTYRFRVRAQDAYGRLSAYSNIAQVTTPGLDTQAPGAPAITAASIASSRVSISWAAVADNIGATGYLIERCNGASCSDFAQIATTASLTYKDVGLATLNTYRYRVRATDAAGNLGTYSNVVNVALAPASETVTYTYDERGRLHRAQTSGGANGGLIQTYDYDDSDNRVTSSVSGSSNPTP